MSLGTVARHVTCQLRLYSAMISSIVKTQSCLVRMALQGRGVTYEPDVTKGIRESTLLMLSPRNLPFSHASRCAESSRGDGRIDEALGVVYEDFNSYGGLAELQGTRKPVVSRFVQEEWRTLNLQSSHRPQAPQLTGSECSAIPLGRGLRIIDGEHE